MASRFVVGIDLGTSHCCLAYIDTEGEPVAKLLEIPQWQEQGVVVKSQLLPSSLYVATKKDRSKGRYPLPWGTSEESVVLEPFDGYVPGRIARELSASQPGRVVYAAKSWLCHGGLDRDRGILPWQSRDVTAEQKLSPVEAAAYYLRYLATVWDATWASGDPQLRLAEQEVVVTVPASFHEDAARLTLEACHRAGLGARVPVRLLEEPQAAFYAWHAHRPQEAEELAKNPEATILVCDVGGGTSDFSLLRYDRQEGPGRAKRIAVSDHLLLGGDNMDLLVAEKLALQLKTIQGADVSTSQWVSLVHQARTIKEQILNQTFDHQQGETTLKVAIAQEGADLFGSSVSLEVDAKLLVEELLEGFMPLVAAEIRPEQPEVGLQEWGLPFAHDPAITKHLGEFVAGTKVDALLVNGGSLKPAVLVERLCQQLKLWQGQSVQLLSNPAGDQAVALGAAWSLWQSRNGKETVEHSLARNLYLQVAGGSALPAHGTEEGSLGGLMCIAVAGQPYHQVQAVSGVDLSCLTGQPVGFRLFALRKQEDHKVGGIYTLALEDLRELPQAQAVLEIDRGSQPRRVPVDLEVEALGVGLLRLFLSEKLATQKEPQSASGRWELQLATDSGSQRRYGSRWSEGGGSVMPASTPVDLEGGVAFLRQLYGKKPKSIPAEGLIQPRSLVKELERLWGEARENWHLDTLRSLWPHLLGYATKRGRSEDHEAAWLNLAGFCLRPGFGHSLDPLRIASAWQVFESGPSFPKAGAVKVQWAVMWRRLAAGLDGAQQTKVFDKMLPQLAQGSATPEVVSLLGALERVDGDRKVRFGTQLMKTLQRPKKSGHEASYWALARVVARYPVYAGMESVLHPDHVEPWLEQLLEEKRPHPAQCRVLLGGARLLGERYLDVSEGLRQRIADYLTTKAGYSPQQLAPLQRPMELSSQEVAVATGDSLPTGLQLS